MLGEMNFTFLHWLLLQQLSGLCVQEQQKSVFLCCIFTDKRLSLWQLHRILISTYSSTGTDVGHQVPFRLRKGRGHEENKVNYFQTCLRLQFRVLGSLLNLVLQ